MADTLTAQPLHEQLLDRVLETPGLAPEMGRALAALRERRDRDRTRIAELEGREEGLVALLRGARDRAQADASAITDWLCRMGRE